MRRRSFFKSLLALTGVALVPVGLSASTPKPSAALTKINRNQLIEQIRKSLEKEWQPYIFEPVNEDTIRCLDYSLNEVLTNYKTKRSIYSYRYMTSIDPKTGNVCFSSHFQPTKTVEYCCINGMLK